MAIFNIQHGRELAGYWFIFGYGCSLIEEMAYSKNEVKLVYFKTKVQFACAKFTRVYNLHTCKYTPGMYFCACERKYTQDLIYIRVN